MDNKIKNKIESISFWKSDISIQIIDGGITNQNFLVTEDLKKYVVRLGDDIPEHLISRSNELAVSKAAASVGISPSISYHEKGLLILEYIESKTLSKEGVKKKLRDIIPLIKKIHYEIPIHLQTAFKHLNYKKGDLPVTEYLSKNILSLPFYPGIEKRKINYLFKSLKSLIYYYY